MALIINNLTTWKYLSKVYNIYTEKVDHEYGLIIPFYFGTYQRMRIQYIVKSMFGKKFCFFQGRNFNPLFGPTSHHDSKFTGK